MRIVLSTHHYPPTYVAGVELLTERLARWLTERGHVVEVICVDSIDTNPPMSVTSHLQDGVMVHRLRLKRTGEREPLGVRFRDDELGAWFEEYLRRTKPDVFHSQSSYVLTASLIEAAKRAKVAVVASLHDYWYLCPRVILLRSNGERCDSNVSPATCARCVMGDKRRFKALERFTEHLPEPASDFLWSNALGEDLIRTIAERQAYLDTTLRSVDQIITPARLTYELLLGRGFAPERVLLFRQGLKQRPPHGRAEQPTGTRLRVGYLGQLAPHKGVHVLVRAFRTLRPGRVAPELSIYGDLSRFPRYAKQLKTLSADVAGVRFGGPYRNEDVWDVLGGLDVLVVPSLWYEISPLVVLEALSAGVPVIATDLRNMNYQVHDEQDGLLFKAGDSADLARQLQRLIDDPDLLPRLIRGIQPVHDVETEMLEIEAVYQSVIEHRARESAETVQTSKTAG